MPAKTEEQRKLFALALSVKRGKTSKKEVSKQVLKLAQDMSEDELSKMASKIKTEATTSASSGSYEAPFGLTRRDMKTLEDMKENKTITLEQLEKIVKRTFIKEEVYSVKPSEFKPETPKVATTKSNINTKDKNKKSTSDKNTKKSGETANKSTKDSMKAVAESLKNNLKGSEKSVENKNRMQNEDERIEAYQNGLSDLTYDNITPEKQKKNAEYLVNDKYMGQGNHQKTSVNQQILDDSKKRQKSRDDSKFNNITSFGSDTEFNPSPKPNLTKGKQLAYESIMNNTTKRKINEVSARDYVLDEIKSLRAETKDKFSELMDKLFKAIGSHESWRGALRIYNSINNSFAEDIDSLFHQVLVYASENNNLKATEYINELKSNFNTRQVELSLSKKTDNVVNKMTLGSGVARTDKNGQLDTIAKTYLKLWYAIFSDMDSKLNEMATFLSKNNIRVGGEYTNENKQNPMKSLNFKTPLKDSKDVLNRIQNSKFPKHLKSNDMVFEMTDGENKYKIRWEGHSSTGTPIILEHRNDKKMKADMIKMEQLGNYNPSKNGSKTSALNENEVLKEMMASNRNLNKPKLVKEMFGEDDEEAFVAHGTYTVSNSGGYEIMLAPSGDAAKVRDAFGGDNPKTSDWLEIEYIEDEDTLDFEPVIDPNGYNIPLNQVMRVNNDYGNRNENYNKKVSKKKINEEFNLPTLKKISYHGNLYKGYLSTKNDYVFFVDKESDSSNFTNPKDFFVRIGYNPKEVNGLIRIDNSSKMGELFDEEEDALKEAFAQASE